MIYLKRFNEHLTDELSIEMVDELRTFARNYLSFLIDDGFRIQVTPYFDRSSCEISIYKQDTLEAMFKWSDIKDQFIPFIYMLDKNYDIISIYDSNRRYNMSSTGEMVLSNPGYVKSVNEIINDDIDDSASVYKINIKVDFKKIDEAKSDWKREFSDESFKDFCDGYLAYLYDDGFVSFYTTQNILFKRNILMLRKELESGDGSGVLDVKPFYWYQISEKFVPFFEMLNKYYPISKIRVVTKEDSVYSSRYERKSKELIFSRDERVRLLYKELPLDEFVTIMSNNYSYNTIEEIIIEVENLGKL